MIKYRAFFYKIEKVDLIDETEKFFIIKISESSIPYYLYKNDSYEILCDTFDQAKEFIKNKILSKINGYKENVTMFEHMLNNINKLKELDIINNGQEMYDVSKD